MDQLAKDAMAARQAHLTYGRYMATKYQPAEKPKPKKKKPMEGPRCTCCGMLIPPGSRRRQYCSAECADRARIQQHIKKE